MNRDQKLIIRVSDEEKTIILQKAESNGMTISSYLRMLGLYSDKIQIETKIKESNG